jgi:predicted NUDIX family NTP pyrophosphohydrolase
MKSAGLLLYRHGAQGIELLLVHPGGPFWAKKDTGGWSIPKGLVEEGEEALAAALREFKEETGFACPKGPMIALGEVKQKSGKTVAAWAVEGDLDVSQIKSNTFTLEWPPKSGKTALFPEIDRAEYFPHELAGEKIHEYLKPLIERLLRVLDSAG